MGILSTGVSKYAFTGELTCPFGNCNSSAVRFIENVTPTRLRYRCRKCGQSFQYDISNRPLIRTLEDLRARDGFLV